MNIVGNHLKNNEIYEKKQTQKLKKQIIKIKTTMTITEKKTLFMVMTQILCTMMTKHLYNLDRGTVESVLLRLTILVLKFKSF